MTTTAMDIQTVLHGSVALGQCSRGLSGVMNLTATRAEVELWTWGDYRLCCMEVLFWDNSLYEVFATNHTGKVFLAWWSGTTLRHIMTTMTGCKQECKAALDNALATQLISDVLQMVIEYMDVGIVRLCACLRECNVENSAMLLTRLVLGRELAV